MDVAALAGSGPGGAVVAGDVEAAGKLQSVTSEDGFEVGTVWRVMAERTTRAWQEVPQFVLTRDVDASRLESWRAVARQKPGCEALGHTDLLVKVCAEALRRHPRLNASWHEGAIVPVTSGRPWVRFMSLSMSRSMYMLKALAPPAARLPPTSVAKISHPDGRPRSATTIVGTVVTSSSSTMRGLVRAT